MTDTSLNLDTFIRSDDRHAWVVENGVNLYVRYNRRCLENGLHACLDIANVNTPLRGQGRFTALMTGLEARPLVLYIENVTNQRLADWFIRRPGYRRDPTKRWDVCFYRLHH